MVVSLFSGDTCGVSLGDEMDRGERGLRRPARVAVVTGADGSLYYESRPLPGMPGGGPPRPALDWGPEFGGGEGFRFRHGGPPRRRPNGLAGALLVLGGLAVLVVIAALALREGDSATASPAPDASQATRSRPDDSTPSPEPTGPDRRVRDSIQIVAANKFYSTGPQASVSCREPQVALNTLTAVQAYYSNLVTCLNEAWTAKVRATQDIFTPPRVVFWGGYVQSPCAGGSPVAFYCGANRTLYLRYDDAIKVWNRSANRSDREFVQMWATGTAGRLYGHHVQQLTGILAAAQQLEYDAPDPAARLELRRRTELQASCLGASFIGANRLSYGITGHNLTIYRRYVVAPITDQNDGGVPPDHGSRASRQYWAERGFNTTDSGDCNTFGASANKVS
jgi:uncharacterized protein